MLLHYVYSWYYCCGLYYHSDINILLGYANCAWILKLFLSFTFLLVPTNSFSCHFSFFFTLFLLSSFFVHFFITFVCSSAGYKEQNH